MGNGRNAFRHIHPAECDWMICYDYRSLEFDTTLIQAYSKISLIAWSMGVWAASQVMKQYPSLPVSQSTAINGTLYPIHETKGITPSVFEGTLQELNSTNPTEISAKNVWFCCWLQGFSDNSSQRPVEELKEELAAIRQQYLSSLPSEFVWQTAIIGDNDRIFLPDHQEQAWRNKAVSLLHVEAAHYQQELFNEVIMNIK